jgi:hypothetical protein
MQTGKGRRWVGAVVAVLLMAAAVLWWRGREIDAVPVARMSIPAPVAQPAVANEVVGAGDPAAELILARRPGAVRRGVQPSRSFDLPRGRAVDVVASLQPRAEAGDNEAALYLFIKIEECRYQLYHGGGNASRPPPSADDSLEAQLIARTPPECHGLTQEQYRNNVRWLEQAADAGVVMAQLVYAGNAEAVVGNSSQMLANPDKVIAYRRKAMQYLRQAAASGSLSALMSLSDAYHYGVLAPRDPIRAYAYYYAKDMASPSAYGRQYLDTYADQLEPAQLATAIQQGKGIYDACCKP